LILYLMEKYPWDFFAVNFSAIDQVQHHFWKYLDGKNEFSDVILNVYKRVDQAVGKICEKMPLGSTVYVMSDHGAGPASPYVIFLDEWLRENGMLLFKSSFSLRGLVTKVIKWALSSSSQILTSELKDSLMRRFPGTRVKSQGYMRRALIDWASTRAFSGEHPSTIRINLKGREAKGIVEAAEYEKLRDELVERLELLKHPETGEKLIEKVYKKEELYHGDYLTSAPDLVFQPKDFCHQIKGGPFPKGYYGQVVSRKHHREFFVNGVHRLNGVFIAAGPGIKKDYASTPLDIIDLFPTIVYSLGMEIPESVDGKRAEEIFEPDHVSSHPIRFSNFPLKRWTAPVGEEVTYEREEARKIEKSLRGLGYID
jgi:predicted AlkP superfamily phosphohydrolase/phosphomutase